MAKILKPLHDRVVIRRIEEEEMAAGGLIIPSKSREKPIQGEVLEVGPGKLLENGTRVPVSVSVGDIVVFAKYGGADVALDRAHEFLVLREDEIMARVVTVADVEEEQQPESTPTPESQY